MSDIFISYRNGDEPFAALLIDETLCAAFGAARVFRDGRTIEIGVDFRPQLWGRIARCRIMAVVIGPRWLDGDDGTRWTQSPDDFVRQEVAMALKIGTNVVPLLIGEAALPAANQLPPELQELASRQRLRIRPRSAVQDLRYVVDRFRSILTAPDGPNAGPSGAQTAAVPDPIGGSQVTVRDAVIGGDVVGRDKIVRKNRR